LINHLHLRSLGGRKSLLMDWRGLIICHFHLSINFSSKGRARINKEELTFFPLCMNPLSVIPRMLGCSFICWMRRWGSYHHLRRCYYHLRSRILNNWLRGCKSLHDWLSYDSFLYQRRLRNNSLNGFLCDILSARNNFSFVQLLDRSFLSCRLSLWLNLFCLRLYWLSLRLLNHWFNIARYTSKFGLHLLSRKSFYSFFSLIIRNF